MKKASVSLSLGMAMVLVLASSVLAQPTNFRAHLSGAGDVDTRGQGQAKFQLEDNDLSFVLAISKLQGDTLAAHIHISAAPGGNGPPVISLCGTFGPPPIPVASCGGPGHPAKATVSLSDAQIANLMGAIAENRAYVNVHTGAFPPGEIRGQVVINP